MEVDECLEIDLENFLILNSFGWCSIVLFTFSVAYEVAILRIPVYDDS